MKSFYYNFSLVYFLYLFLLFIQQTIIRIVVKGFLLLHTPYWLWILHDCFVNRFYCGFLCAFSHVRLWALFSLLVFLYQLRLVDGYFWFYLLLLLFQHYVLWLCADSCLCFSLWIWFFIYFWKLDFLLFPRWIQWWLYYNVSFRTISFLRDPFLMFNILQLRVIFNLG